MTEPLNTSFIPKRNSNTPTRRSSTQRVFIGTLLIQIFFFSVLLACLGVFVYEKKLNRDLETEVVSLNEAIKSFDEEKMKEVVSIDSRIGQVSARLQNTVSISAIFAAMESATIESMQINSLKLKREDDSTISMEAEMRTDSFDSVMFQRGVFERDEKLAVTSIKELKISNPQARNAEVEKSGKKTEVNEKTDEFNVKFVAELGINPESVPHIPASVHNSATDSSITSTSNESVQTSVDATDLDAQSGLVEGVVNQDNI